MQPSWIPLVKGRTVRQARVALGDLFEEHVSRQGFFGTAAMLYHEHPIKDAVRTAGPLNVGLARVGLIDCEDAGDPAAFPNKILHNAELSISLSKRIAPMPYLLRNLDEDTLYFIHEGEGEFATEYGALPYEPGDMILIPKGVTYRIMPKNAMVAVVVESLQSIRITEHKQLGRHAPFDQTVIVTPELTRYDWPAQSEWEVRYKHGDEFSQGFFDYLPFDVVGWKGDCFPFSLNIRDIRPITSERLHLAPSAWSIFEADSFMIVGFLPMMIVQDPEAEELPSRHRNIDSDEVLLLRSTDDRQPDMIGHFPQGITHGPDDSFREAYARIRNPQMQRVTNGISIDSYRRLHRTEAFSRFIGAKLPLAGAE